MRLRGALADLGQIVAVSALPLIVVLSTSSAAGVPVQHHRIVASPHTTTTVSPPAPSQAPRYEAPSETTTTTVPAPPPTTIPPAAPVAQADPLELAAAFQALGATSEQASTFVCIANHESRFDPQAVNPSSGAGGLFQFLPSTWQAIGRTGTADQASVADQVAGAWALFTSQGWSPWIGSCV